MSDSSRKLILDHLRRATAGPGAAPVWAEPVQPKRFSPDQRVDRLRRLMETVRTEVHVSPTDAWIQVLKDILRRKNVRSLLFAPQTDLGKLLEEALPSDQRQQPVLRAYNQDIEDFKAELFGIDAGITSTRGAIAETGALILWPTPAEPRLMSLVPPIHIAVLAASRIQDTFSDVISSENWADRMPTNALLISGPSKTADIEMTLAFGVHGPKELIVIIVEDQ